MEIINRILTGWRMTYVETLFNDNIGEYPVKLFVDSNGVKWMAKSATSLFRVKYPES